MVKSRALHSNRGFTLLEILIVMSILAVLTGMVSPVFRDSLGHMRAENAVRDLQAACVYAQSRAITDSSEVRLNIHHASGTFWLSRAFLNDAGEVEFIPLSEMDYPELTLPENVSLSKPTARYDRKQKTHYIAFYPEGICEPAKLTLKLVDEPRQKYWIEMSGTRITLERSKT